MAAGTQALPIGLDPLIAEAKRRTRRRRALVLVLLVAIAAGTVSLFLELRGPSAAPFGANPSGTSARSPVAYDGSSFTTASGFMGDRDGVNGSTILGCLNHRHYEEGFGLRNRSPGSVTVLSAKWRNSAPGIVQQVATQFRLPVYRPGVDEIVGDNWSRAPSNPLVIPRGQLLTVETDFVFKHCGQLAGGRSVALPGSVTIRYRVNGIVGRKVIKVPDQAFVLTAGPMRRRCAMGLVSTNISCAAAQRAALACHRLADVTSGYCKATGISWSCARVVFHRGAPYVLTCDGDNSQGSDTRPRGFRVRWNAFSQRT